MKAERISLPRHPFAFAAVTFLILGMFAGNTALPSWIPILSAVPVAVFLFLLVIGCVLLQGYVGSAGYRPTPRAMRTVLLLTAIYCWWLTASLFWAPSSESVGSAFDVGVLFLAVLSSYLVFATFGAAAWPSAWWILFILAIIFAVGGFFSDWMQTGRMSAFGGGPNVFVRYMFIGMIASVLIHLETGRKLVLLPLPLFASAAVLSGSRGGLVATAVALVLILVYLLWSRRFWLIAGLGLVGGIGTAIILSVGAFREHVTELIFGRYIELTLEDGYSSGRDILVDQATALIRELPLLGAGVGGFQHYFGRGGGLEHPHNIFLTTWTEAGLVGLILLVVLWAAICVMMLRRWRIRGAYFAAVASVAIMICAQVSGYYLDSRLVWFFAFMCLAIPAPAKKTESLPSHELSRHPYLQLESRVVNDSK